MTGVSRPQATRCTQIGGSKPELDQQRGAEHQEAQDEDGEHGGPVARIREAVVEPAALALLPQRQAAA